MMAMIYILLLMLKVILKKLFNCKINEISSNVNCLSSFFLLIEIKEIFIRKILT